MAISYVGGQVAGRAGVASTASITFALTGGTNNVPQAGDLVVITAIVGSQARNPAQAISGYTALGQLNPTAATYDTSLNVSYKFMGSTPDATFTLPSTGNIADAQRYTIQVFRGVDPTTPLDVTPVSATGTATGRPDPGSITPVTAGAWVLVCGGGAAATGVAYTAPANFTTGFLTGFTADTNDAMVGSGYWSGWTSGAVDPAAYTGGTTGATDSWAAYTIALRPEAANGAPTVLPASTIDSGIGVSFIGLPAGWSVGTYLVAAVQTAGGEAAGIDAAWPGWTQIGVADTGTTGIGSARLTLYGKFAASGETNPDTTDSGDHQLTTMIGFNGVDTTTPVEASATGFNATAATTVSIGSPGSAGGADRMVALFVASGLDTGASTNYLGWNNASVNLVERQDNGTTAGVGGAIGIATGRKAASGAVGASGVTQTSSQAVWISLIIKPASGGGSQTLTPTRLDNAQTFYGPTVTRGPVTLTPGLFTSGTNQFFAATVSQAGGSQTLTPARFDNAGAFYGPTVTRGAVTLQPGRYDNAASFYGPVVTRGAVTLTPARYDNASSFFAPTVTRGAVTLQPGRLDNAQTFFAPQVAAATNAVRYIRDRTTGSVGNGASYWCGIQAIDAFGVNKAREAVDGGSSTVIANFSTPPNSTQISYVLNNAPNTFGFVATGDPYAALIVDLGATFDIASVKIYRYWDDGRTFNETLTQTSVDGIKWTTIWDGTVDGTYAETASGKTIPTKPPQADVDVQLGTIIPLYTNTAGVWTTFQGTIGDIPSIAIFNPASGPGAAYDSAYGAKVDAFRAAGGQVIGYVSTSYAGTVNTARTTAAVNADVLKYHQWYNIDGIFFDEWAPESTYTSYAATIYSYLKGLSSAYIAVGNAGPKLAEVYLSTPYLDKAIIYEETGAKYLNWTIPPWAKNYASTRFAIMLHTATSGEMDIAVGRSKYENVGYVYVTDDVLANPWDTAPTYWSAEVAAAAASWKTLYPTRLNNAASFFAATVTRGAVTLQPARFDNAATFYGHTITTANGTQTLIASRFDNAPAFFGPVVTRGAVSLAPTRLDNSSVIFAPVVTQGAVVLQPARLDNSQSFFAPAVSRGAVTLAPGRLNNSSSFYGPTVSPGPVTLSPARFDGAASFYGPVVTRGPVSLLPARFDNAAAFFGPLISQAGGPQTLLPARLNNSAQFFGPTISTGPVTLQPSRLQNSQTFPPASVILGPAPKVLSPSLLVNSSQIFLPITVRSEVTLFPENWQNEAVFFGHDVGSGFTRAPAGHGFQREPLESERIRDDNTTRARNATGSRPGASQYTRPRTTNTRRP